MGFSAYWAAPWSLSEASLNCAIRIVVLLLLAYFVQRTASQAITLRREVRNLKGILPICSFCKNIRDPKGVWHPLETYISKRSQAEFSHGLCPGCAKENYGDIFDEDLDALPSAQQ